MTAQVLLHNIFSLCTPYDLSQADHNSLRHNSQFAKRPLKYTPQYIPHRLLTILPAVHQAADQKVIHQIHVFKFLHSLSFPQCIERVIARKLAHDLTIRVSQLIHQHPWSGKPCTYPTPKTLNALCYKLLLNIKA